jgi:hypothetical protein
MSQTADKKGKHLFGITSNPKLDEMVQKEFDAHPEGLTAYEMCDLAKSNNILKRVNLYRVMRAMVEGGAVQAPFQKYYCGRSPGGCPYPFTISYTLPRLFDINIEAGMKSFLRSILKGEKVLSAPELKKEYGLDPLNENEERLFAEALKELEDNREIRRLGSLFQGPENPALKSND